MNQFIIKEKFVDLKVRGLKIADIDQTSKVQFVEGEFLAASETGLLSFNRFIKYLASKGKMIIFTRLHLSGDKHLKPCEDIECGMAGVMGIAALFREGYFPNIVEFRFTDLIVEPYSMIGLADALTMNPTLLIIDLSRDNVDEELASAVIQRLYFNPCLTKLILDGNPISVGLFKENVIKPYFNSRKELKIILA